MRFMATSLSKFIDSLTEEFVKLNKKIVVVFVNSKMSRKTL